MIDQIKKEAVDVELNSIKMYIEKAIKELDLENPNFKDVIDSIAEVGIISVDVHNLCKMYGNFEESSDCHAYIIQKTQDMDMELINAFNKKCK